MPHVQRKTAAAIVLAALLGGGPATAQTVVDEWSAIKLPAPPALKAVDLAAPRQIALLVMDFTTQTCTQARRPRCAVSVPKVAKFVNEARSKGAMIIFSIAGAGAKNADILEPLTPAAGEWIIGPVGPDKFVGTDLEQRLKAAGITTVVAMGTQAQTSVLHTAASATLRGFKAVVPVDGMSADDAFPEAYTAWHLATASRISSDVTVTSFALMKLP